jgi:hypothetical protein
MIRKTNLQSIFSILLTTSFVLVFAVFGLAQSGTSSVNGNVADAQGAVVAGASVNLNNPDNGFSRTTTTNENGIYNFTSIPPGKYKITVEKQGFKKTIRADIQAQVDTPATVNVSLEVGNVGTELVTVSTAEDAPINTTNGSIGTTITTKQIIQLPLNARNTPDLLSLQPGVTRNNGTENGGVVNGGRSDQANVTLDGVDVNEQQGGSAFFSVLRVTPEALQEFRVTTTNADANAGRSSGAQVSLVTKSGTNKFHGSAYTYYRPATKFQANDFFNNIAGVPVAAVGRKNIGGSFLGPIKKDRIFFAVFYEKFNEDSETSLTRTVPLATLGTGIVKYRSTNASLVDPTCPAGTPAGIACKNIAQINAAYTAANGVTPGINPIAVSFLGAAAAKYKANDFLSGDGLNTAGFRFNAKTPVRQNVATARIDGKLTDNQDIFLRYTFQSDTSKFTSQFPDTAAGAGWDHPWGIATGHTWIINSNLINKFTYGLTRGSSTFGGDSSQNNINFRFVYSPNRFTRTSSRVTPVHNFVDDITYIRGNHTISTGVNVRLIANRRSSFASSFDNASTNPSFYDESGDVVTVAGTLFPDISSGSITPLRDALTAIIGRYSQYGTNLQYGADGKLLASGTAVNRTFKTEEYEGYIQDSWKMFRNLTVNYGVRYSTSTPVYEANGLQVAPTSSLSTFFDKRVQAAANGQTFNDLITIDKAGKANNKPGYYKQDWNNFAPSVSAAWSPNFENNFLKAVFGGEGKSSIRGGFRMTYDRIGSALVVAFDQNSTLGFGSTSSISANTYNVSTNLAPLFTGTSQAVRPLPGLTSNPALTFPLQTAADEDLRIEQSLDDKLTTPYNYNFNLSYARELKYGMTVEASYVGRIAKNLLISRDTAHFNNLRDPVSGQDFYSVMRQLIDYRNSNTPISAIPNIAWFNRFVPGLATATLTATQAAYRRVARICVNNAVTCTGANLIGGRNQTDFTFVQLLWDDGFGGPNGGNNIFIHPQYATFAAYSTAGESNYNALQLSLRKRFSQGLQFDINYTYGHSLDTASGNERSGTISSGAPLVLNPLVLRENQGNSDFDVRHLVNANYIYELPFGKSRRFLNSNKFANWVLGGWQTVGIFRWNKGFPIGQPFDGSRWATNWNVQSNGVRITDAGGSSTRSDTNGYANIFSDPVAAYRSYRNALPGEAGNRNILREESYISLDAGLFKSFNITERNKITFRLEVFNVSNTQRLTGISDFSLGQDPFTGAGTLGGSPAADFGRYTSTQGTPRTVQFALRFDF